MICAVCETATVGRDLDGPSMAQWRPILIVSLVVVNSDQIKQLKRFQGEKSISFNRYNDILFFRFIFVENIPKLNFFPL